MTDDKAKSLVEKHVSILLDHDVDIPTNNPDLMMAVRQYANVYEISPSRNFFPLNTGLKLGLTLSKICDFSNETNS